MPLDESPKYCAVIECVPIASVDFVSVATPPLMFPAPKLLVPSQNLTLPLRGSGPEGVTVAVKVTA